jgi:transcriptional regulator with XRE-family HTH domain
VSAEPSAPSLLPAMRSRFGRNLLRCRREAGISQEEVGIRAALHRTEIGLLERGERIPRIDTAIKLAGAVGVPLGVLVDGIEWTPGESQRGAFAVATDDGPERVERLDETGRGEVTTEPRRNRQGEGQ